MLPLEAQDGGFVHIYIPSDGQVPMGLKDFTEPFYIFLNAVIITKGAT